MRTDPIEITVIGKLRINRQALIRKLRCSAASDLFKGSLGFLPPVPSDFQHGFPRRTVTERFSSIIGRLKYGGLGADIIYVRLPHRLHTALPNGDIVPIREKKLFSNLLDMIHVHQKTLMTAQKATVPKFFLYRIQGLIDCVHPAVLGMKKTLGIAALDI